MSMTFGFAPSTAGPRPLNNTRGLAWSGNRHNLTLARIEKAVVAIEQRLGDSVGRKDYEGFKWSLAELQSQLVALIEEALSSPDVFSETLPHHDSNDIIYERRSSAPHNFPAPPILPSSRWMPPGQAAPRCVSPGRQSMQRWSSPPKPPNGFPIPAGSPGMSAPMFFPEFQHVGPWQMRPSPANSMMAPPFLRPPNGFNLGPNPLAQASVNHARPQMQDWMQHEPMSSAPPPDLNFASVKSATPASPEDLLDMFNGLHKSQSTFLEACQQLQKRIDAVENCQRELAHTNGKISEDTHKLAGERTLLRQALQEDYSIKVQQAQLARAVEEQRARMAHGIELTREAGERQARQLMDAQARQVQLLHDAVVHQTQITHEAVKATGVAEAAQTKQHQLLREVEIKQLDLVRDVVAQQAQLICEADARQNEVVLESESKQAQIIHESRLAVEAANAATLRQQELLLEAQARQRELSMEARAAADAIAAAEERTDAATQVADTAMSQQEQLAHEATLQQMELAQMAKVAMETAGVSEAHQKQLASDALEAFKEASEAQQRLRDHQAAEIELRQALEKATAHANSVNEKSVIDKGIIEQLEKQLSQAHIQPSGSTVPPEDHTAALNVQELRECCLGTSAAMARFEEQMAGIRAAQEERESRVARFELEAAANYERNPLAGPSASARSTEAQLKSSSSRSLRQEANCGGDVQRRFRRRPERPVWALPTTPATASTALPWDHEEYLHRVCSPSPHSASPVEPCARHGASKAFMADAAYYEQGHGSETNSMPSQVVSDGESSSPSRTQYQPGYFLQAALKVKELEMELEEAKQAFKVGSRVEVCSRGVWHKGTVMRLLEGESHTFAVQCDGDPLGTHTKTSSIRLLDKALERRLQRNLARARTQLAACQDAHSRMRELATRPQDHAISNGSELDVRSIRS